MPNRETPTNYVGAGLLHTAGTEHANKNFSIPIPPPKEQKESQHTETTYYSDKQGKTYS